MHTFRRVLITSTSSLALLAAVAAEPAGAAGPGDRFAAIRDRAAEVAPDQPATPPMATPATAPCWERTTTDPYDDDALDIELVNLGYYCGDNSFVLAVNTFDHFYAEDVDYAVVLLNTDGRADTGCEGDDHAVAAIPSDYDSYSAVAFRTPSCDTDRWTSSPAVAGRLSGDSMGIAFRRDQIGGASSFGYRLALEDVYYYGYDLVPNSGAWLSARGYVPAPSTPTCGGNCFYLINKLGGGPAEATFVYGRSGDQYILGDWDGDGDDTLGVRRGRTYYLTNKTGGGSADVVITFGRDDDTIIVGDWDGDGDDTLGVRRGRSYHLMNSLVGGGADVSFEFGRPDDVILVGDWNGDARDTLAVRRGRTYFLTNAQTGGPAETVFDYGRPDDVVLVGDWNADRVDTFGVRRGAEYFLTNQHAGGAAEVYFVYGRATDRVIIGDWNGDGVDTLGVRR